MNVLQGLSVWICFSSRSLWTYTCTNLLSKHTDETEGFAPFFILFARWFFRGVLRLITCRRVPDAPGLCRSKTFLSTWFWPWEFVRCQRWELKGSSHRKLSRCKLLKVFSLDRNTDQQGLSAWQYSEIFLKHYCPDFCRLLPDFSLGIIWKTWKVFFFFFSFFFPSSLLKDCVAFGG